MAQALEEWALRVERTRRREEGRRHGERGADDDDLVVEEEEWESVGEYERWVDWEREE